MSQTMLITIAALSGFVIGWILCTLSGQGLKKKLNSVQGFLESEKLMKEKFQKENHMLQQIHATREAELRDKITELQKQIQEMDKDILLLQKDNEETERLLKGNQPEIHELKVKLIEASNTIARYKSILEQK